MTDTQEYFTNLIDLLNLEKEEELKQFHLLMQTKSVAQRVEMGICWHPLKIIETGFGFGDYPFAVVERTRAKDLSHQFSSGKPVVIFSSESNSPDPVKAVIQYVNGDQMKLVFFINDEPELLDYAKLGVVLMPDENAFKEQESILKLVSNAKNCRLAELRDVLLLNKPATDVVADDLLLPDFYNDSQKEAICKLVGSEDVFLIHGPPGTGKTTTLIEAASKLVEEGEQVLLCAPSNAAADWLTIKSKEKGLKVLRIGNIARIDETLESATIEGNLRAHPHYSDIKNFRKQSAELRRMAGKYKRQFGKAEREQRKLILQEAKAIGSEARKLEEYLIENIINETQVICCTLMGANHRLIKDIEFETVIIDEAAQSPEPACWVPITKANKVVLAGDPFQLPPTIKSEEAASKGLTITLMEKLLNQVPTQLLNHQYRMNNAIMEFSNRWFYDGKLIAHDSVAHWELANEKTVSFIDTAGSGWEEQLNPETRSVSNPGEAEFIYQQVVKFIEGQNTAALSIGIISPYKQQTRLIQELFANYEKPSHVILDIQTVDSFQGQERDAIFLSLVRSNEENQIGFLKDYRRMNVAMTRAKKKLLVVGDSATLANDKFYAAFIAYSEEISAYHSVWEFEEFTKNS